MPVKESGHKPQKKRVNSIADSNGERSFDVLLDERTFLGIDSNGHDHDPENQVEDPVDLKLHDMIEIHSKKDSLHLSMKMKEYLTEPLNEE